MKIVITALVFFLSSLLLAQTNNEEEVVLKSKPGNLYGTLNVPENFSSTIVLIISGSGPTDRDGNSVGAVGKNNSLKYLAENLAKEGIPSLRFDKRGVGKSASAIIQEQDLRFDTFIDDAIDWGFQILNDVRFKRLIIAGHSEGSLIGMVVAQELEATGYISLAGAGFPIDDVITEQVKGESDELQEEVASIFVKLREGKTVDEVSPDLISIFRPSIQPYFISWIKYQPAKEITKLSMPILLINGTTDIQVSVENAQELYSAKPSSSLVIIEGMNHVFKKAPEDRDKNMATYINPELENVPKLNETIVNFIKSIN